MCFSVNVNLVKEELENRFGATFLDPDKYHPSYYYHASGLPGMPVICSEKPDMIRLMQWGLIPAWVKTRESADEIRYKTFNARAESVDSKPSFTASFSSRRCVVPVKGFYEWQHTADRKIPWYIYRSDKEIMSLAGLWSEWVDTSTGELINTFSVITTDANKLMADIHNSKKRMPVIIEKSSESLWLDMHAGKEDLKKLLEPYPDDILSAYTISDLINRTSVDRNSAEIIKPYNWKKGDLLF
jgi:putative SOS response-associated peptidase YedK